MLRLVCFLLTLLMLTSTAAAQTVGKAPAHSAHAKAGPAVDARDQAMSRLVKASLEQSLKVMYEKQKPVFPFALLQYKNGKVDSWTYQPQKNKDGTFKPQPDEKQWAVELFMRLREQAKTDPNLEIALLTRMDTVKDTKGNDVMGLWTEVDHRDVRPWVVFLPLLKQKDGTYKQGDLVYYATEQPIFVHPQKTPAERHGKAAK